MTVSSFKKQLRDNELKILAEIIRDHIFVPSYRDKTTVFLCGADISDNKTGRYKMAELFKKYPRYELLYPENLFDDLLSGQGQDSLLFLENILANSVDSIVLFPESPGSYAELGAFASNKRLVNKLVCVCKKQFAKKKSFINYGPVRLIKASETGKVFNIVYDDLDSDEKKIKIYKKINEAISLIKKNNPIKRSVANILETENFVLPCVYLVDSIMTVELYKLVEYATGQGKKISEAAARSSITRLVNNHYISRTATGYTVTNNGIIKIRSTIKKSYLDKARMEVMNSQNRKNTIIKTINF